MAEHDIQPVAGTIYAWAGQPSDGKASSDFPLTGNCTCGRFIVRDSPSSRWRHREPDEPPITGPASGGW